MAQHQVKGPLATRFHSMLQERLPMPQPRARPNGAERRAKDLADFAQTGEAQTGEARNPHRTTRLWEFLPEAGQDAREADRLNPARGGRSPDRREDSREHRQGRPSGGSRVSADPGLDAGDRRRPGTEGGCH